eukprot:NODE_1_length_95616_cov_0.657642.p50 type:complete len:220 gc:universal NODE_1_length_95616_cov_0.657642:50453-49794(-)
MDPEKNEMITKPNLNNGRKKSSSTDSNWGSKIERNSSSTTDLDLHPASVIQQLSSLVLVDANTNFIEKQQLINEHSLSLHRHHQLTNFELENKIQFLSRLIMMGAHYVKKVQSTVINLRRDHHVLLEQVRQHESHLNDLHGNIENLKETVQSDISRIEQLEAQNSSSNVMRYTLYFVLAYLSIRKRYRSICTLASVYALISKRSELKEITRSIIIKRMS